MKHRNVFLAACLAVSLVLAGVVFAQRASNIDPATHPNLAEAQQHIQEAVKKIHEAHEVDKGDYGGEIGRRVRTHSPQISET